jgi:hypothetical protein
MSTPPATRADDGFDRHYAEKIWALIPETYRNEDGIAANPGTLRALIEVLAAEAAVARRSIDRLWADSRIDEADDWAVPYIGALVGARPVSGANRTGQRTNVGRTILYRRRLGTVRLAELLADDIADWDAVASEAFRRLLRHWHMLDGGQQPGAITRTPQWGYADLRATRIDSVVDHAHDDVSHYPDFRQHRGVLGRYNIAKLSLHLYRQYAFPLRNVTPVRIAAELYTLDPSGRDVPLFQPGARAAGDCRAPTEWEMRAPTPCRRLNFGGFAPKVTDLPAALAGALAPIVGRRFATEGALIEAANAALSADPNPPNALSDAQSAALIASAMERASPRFNLLPGGDAATLALSLAVGADAAAVPFGPERLYGANLSAWGVDFAPPGWVRALVDPSRGRVSLLTPLAPDQDLFAQSHHYGIFWPVGAGSHARSSRLAGSGFTPIAVAAPNFAAPMNGEHRFVDSRTFAPALAATGIITADGDLTLSAADQERPYVILRAPEGNTVVIRGMVAGSRLVVDGLWIGVFPAVGTGGTRLRIEGEWREVVFRNVSLDPGGIRAAAPATPAVPIPAVTLEFAGAIDLITIEHSIIGRIVEAVSPLDPCATDRVVIADSVITATGATPTIRLRNASLTIDRSTVLGNVVCGRIDASTVLVAGRVLAEDQQAGCFRFSAALSGGRVPHPYESQFFAGSVPAGTFVSTTFGDPGFVQLGPTAPAEIREGGENGVEMGAFAQALDPIKRVDLAAKLAEFMPINCIAQLVFET